MLRVLVASPSDVQGEREACQLIVDELNVMLASLQKGRFDLVRWETHAAPGMGSDAQDVVNRQIPDDYEIFVGIMWARCGTATPRAGSGTEEEFNRAYSRYQADPSSVSIMLYFKVADVPFDLIDPEQLTRVAAFKARVAPLGLYRTFATTDGFADLLRVHLAQALLSSPPLDAATAHSPEDEDEGYIDLLETALDGLRRAAEVVQRMNEAMEEVAEQLTARTGEVGGLKTMPEEKRLATAKRWARRVAGDMTAYASRVDSELPTFENHFKDGVAALGKALAIEAALGHVDHARTQSMREALAAVAMSLHKAQEAMREVRGAVSTLPRIATDINRARRRVLTSIDGILAKWNLAAGMISELQHSLGGA